jgi:ketosteroid isomerase-like protein
MRKPLLRMAALCVAAFPIFLSAQDQAEAARLRAAEDQLTGYYRQRQVAALAALLDENFVITFEDGSTFSKTGYISFMAAPSDRVDIAEMQDIRIRIHRTTAIVTGIYHERGDTKGAPYDYYDRFTDIWKKKAGKWLLIASHYALPLKQ